MKSNNLIWGTFLFLCNIIIYFTAPLPCSLAQEVTDEKGLSTEKIRETIGSSGPGFLSSGSETQKYYRCLSDSQKQALIQGLSPDEKTTIFECLSEEDKLRLFKSLTYTEKRNLFISLSNTGKKDLCQSLKYEEKRY